jgi:hypothetical protein
MFWSSQIPQVLGLGNSESGNMEIVLLEKFVKFLLIWGFVMKIVVQMNQMMCYGPN